MFVFNTLKFSILQDSGSFKLYIQMDDIVLISIQVEIVNTSKKGGMVCSS